VTIVQINGLRKSSDAHWNDSRIAYWGIGETISGNGTQRGYFINKHTDGGTDRRTFDAHLTTAGSNTTLEGTFAFTGGTGKFNGRTGARRKSGRPAPPLWVEHDLE